MGPGERVIIITRSLYKAHKIKAQLEDVSATERASSPELLEGILLKFGIWGSTLNDI
jgi:hypothetical protein